MSNTAATQPGHGPGPTPGHGLGEAVFVWPEGPGFQSAGQSLHQECVRQHFADLGFRTTVLVPGTKITRLVRRVDTEHAVVTAGERLVGPYAVVAPKTAISIASWRLFRVAPRKAQRALDDVRSKIRSRKGVDFVMGAPLGDHDQTWLHDELQRRQPTVVAPFTSFCAPTHASLPASVRASIAFLSDDEAARHESLTAAGMRVAPFGYTRADMEASLVGWSVVSTIQWDERRALEAAFPAKRIITTPAARALAPAPVRRDAEAPTVLFIGSGTSHNVDGLRWFLADIWPQILRDRPDAMLQVAGTVCARVDLDATNVTGLGEVGDLDAVTHQACVLVVPLRAGSGLKVKVVDGLCTAGAIVTTPIGAQGFAEIEPAPFVVAESAVSFAEAVVALLGNEDLRVELRTRALEAARRFTPEAAFEELDAELLRQGALPDALGATAAPMHLAITVCSYRRPELLGQLLRSLDVVRLPQGVSVEVHVIDNDPDASAAPVVDAHRSTTGLSVRRHHLGSANIAAARNAALDVALADPTIDALVFLDDDETPDPDWLEGLVAMQRRFGCDVVIGPVLGELPETAPEWVADGRYFEFVSGTDGQLLREGITGNAFISTDVLRRTGVRFEPAFGRSGGEDQHFFRNLCHLGAQIRYAAAATARETVPAARATSHFLLRRSYRTGNTIGLLDRDSAALLRLAKAIGFVVTGLAGAGSNALRARTPWHGLLRAARGVGMLTGLAGRRYDFYASPSAGQKP